MIRFQPPRELLSRVNAAISAALDRGQVSEDGLQSLRRSIESSARIDYERLAWAHACAYYWANYFKARIACAELDWRPSAGRPVRLLDLGCGSGAALAGVVDHLREGLGFRGSLHVEAVDASPRQLQLLGELTQPYLEQCGASVEVRAGDVRAMTFDGDVSLVLASYLLGELDASTRRDLLVSVFHALRDRPADLLVAEADESAILEEIQGVGQWPTHQRLVATPVTLPIECLHERAVSKRRFTLAAALFRGLPWSRSAPPPELVRYGQAWERHDLSSVRNLFCADAIYEIGPDRVLLGIEQVCAYWEENRRSQDGVEFSISRWTRSGVSLLADWSARFVRTDLGRRLRLKGAMELELEPGEGRVRRLAEYYLRRDEPIHDGG